VGRAGNELEELEVAILRLLETLEVGSFKDLAEGLEREGYVINRLVLRKVISDMLRSGVIVKDKHPSKPRFIYRAASKP